MRRIPVLLFILAGCAVRCDDDNNYYIIELPETEPSRRRPFDVYWNVPTMQCRSKNIPFTNLYENFGIIQNEKDDFRGNKIAILYDPGLFPALLKNESSGKFKFRNGGVPQEGNLTLHLDVFKEVLVESIPDKDFDGIAIIDFESWRPILRQNFGVLLPYKDISYQIERNRHKWWIDNWIKQEAKTRFEEAGRKFMQTSLLLAKQLRPKATWGYYGFPYCFNMANGDLNEHCSKQTRDENDQSYWLWSESTSLYPSLYSPRSLSSAALSALAHGRVREAQRVSRGSRILPYVWFRYRDGGFMRQKDLAVLLETIYESNATGFIIWGSSNDVNTAEKCHKLHKYIYNVLGPMVANYTKINSRVGADNYITNNSINNNDDDNKLSDEFNNNDNKTFEFEPESNWIPPENYTNDIIKYVEEEFNNKTKEDKKQKESKNEIIYHEIDKSSLIDVIKNIVDKIRESESEMKMNDKFRDFESHFKTSTTATNFDREYTTHNAMTSLKPLSENKDDVNYQSTKIPKDATQSNRKALVDNVSSETLVNKLKTKSTLNDSVENYEKTTAFYENFAKKLFSKTLSDSNESVEERSTTEGQHTEITNSFTTTEPSNLIFEESYTYPTRIPKELNNENQTDLRFQINTFMDFNNGTENNIQEIEQLITTTDNVCITTHNYQKTEELSITNISKEQSDITKISDNLNSDIIKSTTENNKISSDKIMFDNFEATTTQRTYNIIDDFIEENSQRITTTYPHLNDLDNIEATNEHKNTKYMEDKTQVTTNYPLSRKKFSEQRKTEIRDKDIEENTKEITTLSTLQDKVNIYYVIQD